GLLAPHERRGNEDVANGIAYDASADRLFLTGKLWPRLYEVRLRRR
ncbi:MAG: glutamine cyclotransferase, partial [Candidatus Rokuibacteriota bacterium]